MRLHTTGPRVLLIASTVIDWQALGASLETRGLEWRLPDGESDGALLAEFAGRHCYNSFGGPNGNGPGRRTARAYISHLIEAGHGSVLEHVNFTFHVAGVSRGFTHELVRHRAGCAYSQASTRFRDEARHGAFVVPPTLRENPEALALLRGATAAAVPIYQRLKAIVGTGAAALLGRKDQTRLRKIARGAARCILPIGLESPITVTMNARALRGFIDQRATEWADAEIREVAVAMWRLAAERAPELFADYSEASLPDGTASLSTPYRKV